MKSELTNPPKWYIVTRYRLKKGIDAKNGEKYCYLIASKKYDVTEQMQEILRQEQKGKK